MSKELALRDPLRELYENEDTREDVEKKRVITDILSGNQDPGIVSKMSDETYRDCKYLSMFALISFMVIAISFTPVISYDLQLNCRSASCVILFIIGIPLLASLMDARTEALSYDKCSSEKGGELSRKIGTALENPITYLEQISDDNNHYHELLQGAHCCGTKTIHQICEDHIRRMIAMSYDKSYRKFVRELTEIPGMCEANPFLADHNWLVNTYASNPCSDTILSHPHIDELMPKDATYADRIMYSRFAHANISLGMPVDQVWAAMISDSHGGILPGSRKTSVTTTRSAPLTYNTVQVDSFPSQMWSEGKEILRRTLSAYGAYQEDVYAIFERPLLDDVTVKQTGEFFDALAYAQALDFEVMPRDPADVREFCIASRKAWAAWNAADRYAREVGLGTMSVEVRDLLRKARSALEIALSPGSSDDERALSLSRCADLIAKASSVRGGVAIDIAARTVSGSRMLSTGMSTVAITT